MLWRMVNSGVNFGINASVISTVSQVIDYSGANYRSEPHLQAWQAHRTVLLPQRLGVCLHFQQGTKLYCMSPQTLHGQIRVITQDLPAHHSSGCQ
jgi:hypothetical protein